jgi:hypothetical protein
MPATLLKGVQLAFLLFLGCILSGMSQQPRDSTIALIPYIQQLEKEFDVKFSYVDEDLRSLRTAISTKPELSAILSEIAASTTLEVQQLSERYYTITFPDTLDLCALVLDNFEENNAVGASVEILGSTRTTLTGPDGRFYLENVARDATLRIRHIGFKTRYISAREVAAGAPCAQILLGVFYQQLEEVVVSHYLTSGITRQWDGSLQLNTEEFGILPGLIEPDVLQTVQALPGIRSIDETVSDINIRGGTNDQNLLLWDGIKMYQSGHFFGLISAFNPYLTEKVTVIKNGTSPKFGDGVSGIISIETKDTIQDIASGGAGLNLISGDLYAHLPLNKSLALQFSARRSVTDFLNTPTYNQFFERAFQDTAVKDNQGGSEGIRQDEAFYFYDFTAKVLYDLNDDHALRLSLLNVSNTLNYTETAEDTGRSNQSTLDQENLAMGLNVKSKWTGQLSTDLTAYFTRYTLDARNITAQGQQQLFQNNEVDERSVKLLATYNFDEEFEWSAGYHYTETGITNTADVTQPPFFSDVKGVIRTHAPFTELVYVPEDAGLKVAGGGRLNYIENLDNFSTFILEPRINVSLALGRNFRLELLGEFKNQTTNQIVDLEQNFLGIEKRRWILSNTTTDTLINGTPNQKALPVVTSKQGSAGVSYDDGNWVVGVEGFYKMVDGISTATQGFQNKDQFNGEIGNYDVHGLELLINHKNELFSSWLSYSYNINNYSFDDIDPSSFPNNLDIRHTLTLAGTYTYNNLKIGGGLNYRSGKPYTEPEDEPNATDTTVFPNKINYKDPNSSRLPHYLRADASATYDFSVSRRLKASIGVSVLNLLNKRNILNTYYRLNQQNEIETIESVSLGLTPNLSFRMRF